MNRYRFYEIIQAHNKGEDISHYVPKNAPEAVLLADLLGIKDAVDNPGGGGCTGEVVLGESTVLKVDGKETISVLDFKELGIRIATMSPEQQQALIVYMIEAVPQNTANMLYSWRDEVFDSYTAVYLLNYDGYLSLSVGSVYPHSTEANLQLYGSKAVFRLNLSTFEVDGDDDIGQYLVYKSHDLSKASQYHTSPMANLVVKGDINGTIEDSVPITYYTLNDYLFQNLGLGIREIVCAGKTVEEGGSAEPVKLLQPIIEETITAVPNNGFVNSIHFNTDLSPQEVETIIKNANLNFVDVGMGIPMYIALLTSTELGILIADYGALYGGETTAYVIVSLDFNTMFFASEALNNNVSGWNTELFEQLGGNTLPLNSEVYAAVGELTIGAQNESIKDIINCYSIIDTGEIETVKELSGDYHLENYTVTPQETTAYNVLDLIGEKTETKMCGNLLVSDENTNVQGIYFNTNLTPLEVADIISKLNYKSDPNILDGIPFYIAYANPDLSKCIAIVNMYGQYVIVDGNFFTMEMSEIFVHMPSEEMSMWVIADRYWSMNNDVGVNYIEQLQINVGDQNGKLTSLISMNNDFEEVTTTKQVFPKEITVDIKSLEEQINTLTSTNEQLTSTNEQLTSTNEQLTSDLAAAPKNIMYDILAGTRYFGTIEFPSTMNTIRPYLFYDWNIDGITFSGFVNPSIGEYAFSRSNIITIDIPDNISAIYEGAFKDCTRLNNVTLPDALVTIKSEAFRGCTSLKNITIPDNVRDIEGGSTFEYCCYLESIIVSENNLYYDSRNNCNAIIETSTNKLIVGCKNTVIPDGVICIGESAFYGQHYLTSIAIPDSVTSIGEYAFSICSRLSSVIMSNNITNIERGAFASCGKLTSITIPDGVTSIGIAAFVDCTSLTSITIPDSIISIGGDVRDEEGNLINITATNPFNGCESIESIVVDQYNQNYDSRNNCNAIIETASNKLIVGCKNTVIPDGVTSIGEAAFWGAKGLTSIIIPISVTSIGLVAFANCTSLTDIYYRGTQEQWNDIDISDRNTTIGNKTIHYNYEG